VLVPGIYEQILLYCDELDSVVVIRDIIENLDKRVNYIEDIPIGTGEMINLRKGFSFPPKIVEKRMLGSIDGKKIFLFNVFPFSKVDSGCYIMARLRLMILGRNLLLIKDDSKRAELFRKLIGYPDRSQMIDRTTGGSKGENGFNDRIKILITKEGIYSISGLALRAAGLDIKNIDPRYLTIIGPEGEVPIRVVGESDGLFDFNDRVEFWAEQYWIRSGSGEIRAPLYTDHNVYWLKSGSEPGVRFGQEECGPVSSSGKEIVYSKSFPYRKHFEKNIYFDRLPYAKGVENSDYWIMTPGIAGGEKRDVSFILDMPDLYGTQLARLRIRLRGRSQIMMIHPVEIYINDRRIVSGSWQMNEAVTLESEGFTPAYLKEGENRLTIINRSEGGELAYLFLDWFEITYPRLYKAVDDYIRFKPPQYSAGKTCRFEIEGFSEPEIEIFKKGVSKIWGSEVKSVTDTLGNKTYTVVFEDKITNEDVEYVASTVKSMMMPDSLVLVKDSGLRSGERGGDYVVIIPDDSLGEECLEDLILLRQDQGHDVEVVLLDDIYNEFGNGMVDPSAIRNFLRYGFLNWSPPIRYVLLIGDGYYYPSSDRKDNLIPVVHYQTVKYGGAVSDHWYTLLQGGDDFPDVAIGRFPVSSKKELKAVVSKIVEYERNGIGEWNNRYLLIGAGGHGGVFKSQSETLIRDVLSPSLEPARLYLFGGGPYYGGTEELLNHLSDGAVLVNFRGHGGGAIWSDGGLLDLDDVELIENSGRLPVVTSMTCFTGDFAHNQKGLGEVLFTADQTGCVAFWGSSGLGWIWNDYYLLTELYKLIDENSDLTLGEIIREAKSNYLMTHRGDLPLSEVYQYNLLGDPGLRIAIPDKRMAVDLEKHALETGDSLSVVGEGEIENFNLSIDIAGDDGGSKQKFIFSDVRNNFDIKIPLPQEFDDIEGGVRVFAWNAQSGYRANGFVRFSLGESYIDSIMTIPLNPTHEDSIYIAVKVEDQDGVANVFCRIISPYSDTLKMEFDNSRDRYKSVEPVGPFKPAEIIEYSIFVEDSAGNSTESESFLITIPSLPDLSPVKIELDGTSTVLLKSLIANLGDEDADSVVVRFQCEELNFVAYDTISVSGHGSSSAFVPINTAVGEMDFAVVVDPDSSIEEGTKANNTIEKKILIDRFNITKDGGSWNGASSPDTVGIEEKVFLYVPEKGVGENTVVFFDILKGDDEKVFKMNSGTGRDIFGILFPCLNEESTLGSGARLYLSRAHDDTNRALRPYVWEESIQTWRICNYSESKDRFVVSIERGGFYTLIDADDTEPPRIEIQVEQQPFAEGSYTTTSPMISLVIEDDQGVDLRKGRVQIFIDQSMQDPSAIVFSDSIDDSRSVSVSLRPDLQPGEHSIYAQAYDVNGNFNRTETIHFRVGSGLKVQYLGNHPNPFKFQTVFVYILTDAAVSVSLKIYTVSGRLIRTFDDPEMSSPDYHEVVWDGTDQWGDEVSNGVYFFRLKVKGRDVEREVTGKIARLR